MVPTFKSAHNYLHSYSSCMRNSIHHLLFLCPIKSLIPYDCEIKNILSLIIFIYFLKRYHFYCDNLKYIEKKYVIKFISLKDNMTFRVIK